jgi:hypothetical protein
VRDLLSQQAGDLRRPEELVLEVDEPLRIADRRRVGLQDAEVAAGNGGIDVLRHGPHDLQLDLSCRLRRRGRRKLHAVHLVPAHAEVLGDVGDSRALDASSGVVPTDRAAGRMLGRVEPIAGL